MKDAFRKIANKISYATGTAGAFLLALSVIVVWGVTGPAFDFSNTWQLVVNTGTTIITFLMVFLIQNTQNRDGKAMQLKLDELIRATKARDAFVDLEELTDDELAALDREFRDLHDKQISSKLMKKLHKSIEAENNRRSTLGNATHAITNLLTNKHN
jgi:low affinity Fe/Cu permease